MMPEMLTDLGITKVNIGLVNILIDDKHIMFDGKSNSLLKIN